MRLALACPKIARDSHLSVAGHAFLLSAFEKFMLSILRTYIRMITCLNHGLFKVAALLMLVIVPAMMTEVISRYVFHRPTVWGMELAVLLFGPYFLLGGPYLLHIGGHVNMDLIRVRMPKRTGRFFDVLNQIIILFFCAVLLKYSLPLVEQAIAYRETTFSAWNPPLWPFKIAVPLALALLGLQSLAELLRQFIDAPATISETKESE